jgi:acyl-coenzyme A synthetase/AMP-(fatty) acid ligase
MQAVPNAAYHNWYGPTETNVCTAYRVAAIPNAPLPIGQACAGYTLSLIDEDDTLAADAGELVAAGASLMSGYWNDPERTAASLIALPDGRVAYRTRDHVQKLPDGGYAFLGRIDHMIKSKGYRIEPAEIEHVLHQHPAVNEAVVIPVPDANWGSLLKAIIVAEPTPELHRMLKAWCSERLPAYMIPTYWSIQTDLLPRTATGKIDRTRLT